MHNCLLFSVLEPGVYPCGTSRAGNRTRAVEEGVQSVNHYTTGPFQTIIQTLWKLTYTTFHIQNKIIGLVAERMERQI